MNEENWKRLIDFVKKYWPVGNTKLLKETRLQDDLGIKGDDADIFIFKFSKEFDISINIDLSKYFEGYSDDILTVVVRLIREKVNKNSIKRHALTLGDLYNATITGRLDDADLNK